MKKKLVSLCTLMVFAPTALAQGAWTMPANCPKKAAMASIMSVGGPPVECRAGALFDVCHVKVEVTEPRDGNACVAAIGHSEMKVTQGTRPFIIWTIAAQNCLPDKCKFDTDSGISFLQDPKPASMYGKVFDDSRPRVFSYSDRNARKVHPANVEIEAVKYEPHVWWRPDPKAAWQSCCPVDPKIVNDGP
jgi:hypothetical protein